MMLFARSLLSALLLVLAGCGRQEVSSAEHAPQFSRQYRQGSMTVGYSISETNMASSGEIQLMLTVQAPRGADVVFPDIGKQVESFLVSGSRAEPMQNLTDGQCLLRQVWELVPAQAGNAVVPPLEVIAGVPSIKTDPVSIWIASILPPDLETFEIKDIAAPVSMLSEQERQRRLWLIVLGVTVGAVVVGAGLRLYWKFKIDCTVSPRAAALQALDALEVQNPEPVPFVHELSRILRNYLNARFHIPALESTSSELAPMLDNPELVRFLAECDDIKFAHVVIHDFIPVAVGFVRSYIDATTPSEDLCD